MSMNAIKMKAACIQLPLKMVRAVDELVRLGLYPTRAEAIRLAVRDLLNEHRDFKHFAETYKIERNLQ